MSKEKDGKPKRESSWQAEPKSLPRIRVTKKEQRDDIGYGRPPREHQFKPGQSGNPKGRPKGTKNESTILKELLERKILLREGGKPRKAMVLEAIHLRIAEDALRGNVKSAAFTLNRYGALVSRELQPTEVDADDRAVLDGYVQRLLAERDGGR